MNDLHTQSIPKMPIMTGNSTDWPQENFPNNFFFLILGTEQPGFARHGISKSQNRPLFSKKILFGFQCFMEGSEFIDFYENVVKQYSVIALKFRSVTKVNEFYFTRAR